MSSGKVGLTYREFYREMLPRALPEKQQSIPMPFYSPQNFPSAMLIGPCDQIQRNNNFFNFLINEDFCQTPHGHWGNSFQHKLQQQYPITSRFTELTKSFSKVVAKKIYINKIQNIRKPITENLPLRCLCYTVAYIRGNRGICNERQLTHKRRYRQRIPRKAADPRCRSLSLSQFLFGGI